MDYKRTFVFQVLCAGASILIGVILAFCWYQFEYNDMGEIELAFLCAFFAVTLFILLVLWGDGMVREEKKRVKDLQELYEGKFKKVVKALEKTKEKLTEQQTKYKLLKEKLESNGVQQGQLHWTTTRHPRTQG